MFVVRTNSDLKKISLNNIVETTIIQAIIKEHTPVLIKPTPKKKKINKLAKKIPLPTKAKKSVESKINSKPTAPNEGKIKKQLLEIEKYALELRSFIESKKFYPRLAKRLKQAGDVKVKLTVNNDGKFHNISIAKSSPYPILNEAAIKLINQLQKFKPLPLNVDSQNFSIPIKYKL